MREHRTRRLFRSKEVCLPQIAEVSAAYCPVAAQPSYDVTNDSLDAPGLKIAYLRSSQVISEVFEPLTYFCPHCRALLDSPKGGWDGWVRCRACSRLFLPQEFGGLPEATEAGDSGAANGSPIEFSELAGDGLPRSPAGRMAHTSIARVVLSSGFVICLLLTLIKFLDFSPGPMAIFGFMTIVFFLLLMRTPRKRLLLPRAAAIPPQGRAIVDPEARPSSNT